MAKSPPIEPFARRVGGNAVERPREQSPRGVPIALRSAQHVFVSRGAFEQAWTRRIVLIEWVIHGEAAMAVGGRRYPFLPGQVAIYLPSIPLQFWAVAPVSEMCWFSLDGPLAEAFAFELQMQPGVYPYGDPPVAQIHTLMESLKQHTVQGWRRASLLAIDMMYHLANVLRAPEVPSAVEQARAIIQQEFADPDLSLESIAGRLHYHRGSLSRMFHHAVGLAMMDYLTEVRLQQAKSLLQHSPEKVSEVARRCGFRDAAYFCRWMRKHTGVSPMRLRRISTA